MQIPVPPEVVIPMIFSQMEDEPRLDMAIGLLACEDEAGKMVEDVKRDIRFWIDSYVKTAKALS